MSPCKCLMDGNHPILLPPRACHTATCSTYSLSHLASVAFLGTHSRSLQCSRVLSGCQATLLHTGCSGGPSRESLTLLQTARLLCFFLKILLKAPVPLPLLQNQRQVGSCCRSKVQVVALARECSTSRAGTAGPGKTSFLADGVQAHHQHALGLEKVFQMHLSLDNSESPGRRVSASTFFLGANTQSLGPPRTCHSCRG